jgi:DNA-binding CsgD family transcriptional regulator
VVTPDLAAELGDDMATAALRGREDQIEFCRGRLETLAEGHGSVVLIEGPPGIGKSRLLRESVALARARGITVAACTARPRAGTPPLEGLLTTLRAGSSSSEALDRLLRPSGSGAPSRLTALVRRRARKRPLLVSIDNLHWADAATLGALRFLVPALADYPVLWMLAGVPAPASPALASLTTDLVAHGATALHLPRLTHVQLAALATDALGAPPDHPLMAVIAQSDGVPHLALELIHTLGAQQAIQMDGDHARLVGAGASDLLTDWYNRQLGRVSLPTRHLLEIASVFGRSFEIADVARVLRCPVAQLLPGVEEAIAARLLMDDGALSFRHELTREAVYHSITPSVRASLHTEAALALVGGGSRPEAVAHLAGGAGLRDGTAIGVLERAAVDTEVAAPETAAQLQLQALNLTAPADCRRPQRLLRAIHMLVLAGHVHQAQGLTAAALDTSLPAELRGPLHLHMAQTMLMGGHPREALTHTRAALELPGVPARTRAWLLATQAKAETLVGHAGAAIRSGDAAVVVARSCQESGAECEAFLAMSGAEQRCGRLVRSVQLATQAVRSAATGSADARRRQPHWVQGRGLMLLDRLPEASTAFEHGRREAERMRSVDTVTLGHAERATLLLQLGRLSEAVGEAEAGLTSAEELGTWEAAPELYAVLVEVAALEGDLDRAAELARRGAQHERAPHGLARLQLTWATALLEEEMQPSRAWARLGVVFDLLPESLLGLVAHPLAGPRLVRLALGLGEDRRAHAALAALDRLAALNPGVQSLGMSARLARGILEGDALLLQESVVAMRSSPRPLERAWVLETAASCLKAPWSQARRSFLEQALEEYERVGAIRPAVRVREQMLRSGPAPVQPSRCLETDSGWESLTAAELRIARLVSQGLTNREIARRLFLSQHTVDSHLKHTYPKLGIRSRVQLTLVVLTHDDPPCE